VSAAVNGTVEVAGPQQFRFDELIREGAARATTLAKLSSTRTRGTSAPNSATRAGNLRWANDFLRHGCPFAGPSAGLGLWLADRGNRSRASRFRWTPRAVTGDPEGHDARGSDAPFEMKAGAQRAVRVGPCGGVAPPRLSA